MSLITQCYKNVLFTVIAVSSAPYYLFSLSPLTTIVIVLKKQYGGIAN